MSFYRFANGLRTEPTHAKLLLGDEAIFLDRQDFLEHNESDRRLIWQVNLTVALYLLLAQERTYDDLFELHKNFYDIFGIEDIEVHEWQISLLLDLKRDLWTCGVQQKKFTEAEGLRSIFLVHDEYPESKKVQEACFKASRTVQNDLKLLKQRQITYYESYKEQLQQLTLKALGWTAPTPELFFSAMKEKSSSSGDTNANPNFSKTGSDVVKSSDATPINGAAENVEHLNGRDRTLFFSSMSSSFSQDNHSVESRKQWRSTATSRPGVSHDPMRSTLDEATTELNGASSQGEQPREAAEPSTTREQYERAKLAASAKAASRNKGMPLQPSQRRPWSVEEEHALMAGLDRVQGPHWSQILAMYGQSGTINDMLKDRNQVQLKDKARNLKLFFLKSGQEVPHYLKNVTGELKRRAPMQETKKEETDFREATGPETNSDDEQCEHINDQGAYVGGQATNQMRWRHVVSGAVHEPVKDKDKDTGKLKYRNDDDEDLSNAIQLALQAIQEKGNSQQLGEADAGRPNQREQHQREKTEPLQ